MWPTFLCQRVQWSLGTGSRELSRLLLPSQRFPICSNNKAVKTIVQHTTETWEKSGESMHNMSGCWRYCSGEVSHNLHLSGRPSAVFIRCYSETHLALLSYRACNHQSDHRVTLYLQLHSNFAVFECNSKWKQVRKCRSALAWSLERAQEMKEKSHSQAHKYISSFELFSPSPMFLIGQPNSPKSVKKK